MNDLGELADSIIAKRREIDASRALLVGISGIDASGKGFVASQLAERLANLNVAVINVDGWLNLPNVRFTDADHGRHFYENAFRLEEMFESLILPLKQDRSIDITADLAEETATKFRPLNYVFDNIDIILLEGIFIFKKPYVDHFDRRIWVECSFLTALKRAVARSQEGLSSNETIAAYEKIYFPAQRLHNDVDSPKFTADIIFLNG